MAAERTTAEILETLAAQARLLWGETDAERQRPALYPDCGGNCRGGPDYQCRLTWSHKFLPDLLPTLPPEEVCQGVRVGLHLCEGASP